MSEYDRTRSERAEKEFFARLEKSGYQLVDYQGWRGRKVAYPAICPKGHDCLPRPSSLQQGQGGCRACARRDPKMAEKEFFVRIEKGGYQLVDYQGWSGSKATYSAICSQGHKCSLRPHGLHQGEGGCRACASNSPEQAEKAFFERIEAKGIRLISYTGWRGSRETYIAICSKGHPCQPRPNTLQQGKGGCATCAHHDE